MPLNADVSFFVVAVLMKLKRTNRLSIVRLIFTSVNHVQHYFHNRKIAVLSKFIAPANKYLRFSNIFIVVVIQW